MYSKTVRRVVSSVPGSIFVLLCWLVGVLIGFLYYRAIGSCVSALMRSSVFGTVSIVGGLAVVFLPLCFAALAVIYSRPVFLYTVVILKAVFYTVATFGCFDAFGQSGWLVQLLVLFTDNLSTVFLLISILRIFRSPRRRAGGYLICYAISGLFSLLLEHHYILPLIEAI